MKGTRSALLVTLLLAATPASAGAGFPSLDPSYETVIVSSKVDSPEADTRGAWSVARGRVAPDIKRARTGHHWFPIAEDATLADGFVRFRIESPKGARATLMLRSSWPSGAQERLSGYGVVLAKTRIRFQRWDAGIKRRLVSDKKVKRMTSVEVVVWMVGPHMNVAIFDGTTFEPLHTVAVMDPRYPSGRVGVVVTGRRANEQALTVLSTRPAGRESRVRDDPPGTYRYLEVDKGAFAALPGFLRRLAGVMERRDDHLLVRLEPTEHERWRRAGVEARWIYRDTPYKYVNQGIVKQLGKAPEKTAKGFRIDQSYKDAAMVEDLVRAYHARFPTITRLVELGQSREGRSILALKISDAPNTAEGEPAVFLNGSHHGNELLTVEFMMDAIQTLLEGYGNDRRVTRWVNALEIWCVPLVNPDGNHTYLNTSIYAGRKNIGTSTADVRHDTSGGVDLNRNYPFRWGALGELGSRSNPMSEYYRGPYPASEPETRALMRLTDSEHFVASISYHTVSNVILVPYTTDGVPNPTGNEAWSVARTLAKATPAQPTGKRMGVAKKIYSVDGVDQDHFRAAHGTVALLVEGAYHNPYSKRTRLKTIGTTRPTWTALLDRVLDGPGIRGHVRDANGAPLAAEVVVEQLAPQFDERWTSRCRDGRFDRLVPASGTYTLRVTSPGFEAVTQQVRVARRGPATADIVLRPRAEDEVPRERLCGDPALLSPDHLCLCRQGQCVTPGPPSFCLIDDTCHPAGAAAADGSGSCDPATSQTHWSAAVRPPASDRIG